MRDPIYLHAAPRSAEFESNVPRSSNAGSMGQFLSSFSPTTMVSSSPSETSSPPRKMRKVRFESAQQKRVTRSSVIIPESPDPSFKTDSPYCSRSLREVLAPYDTQTANITIPSQIAEYDCESQIEISQVATTLETNTGKTMSGLGEMNCFDPLQASRAPEVTQTGLQDMSLGTTYHRDYETPSQQRISEFVSSPILFSETGSKDAMECAYRTDSKNCNDTPVTPVTNVCNMSARKKIRFGAVAEPYCTSLDPVDQDEYKFVHIDDKNFHEACSQDSEAPIRSTGSFLRMLQEKSQKTQVPVKLERQSPAISSTPFPRTDDYISNTQNSLLNSYHLVDCSAQSLDVIPRASVLVLPTVDETNVPRPVSNVVPPSQDVQFAVLGVKASGSVENYREELNDSQNRSKLSDDISFNISLPFSSHDSSPCSLPSNVLLSNYCSEYNRSYISKDLKPNLLGNYCSSKSSSSLMKDFYEIIPKNQTLQEFFDATDQDVEEVAASVQNEVKHFLDILDSNEFNES